MTNDLITENARLREALQHYANRANWALLYDVCTMEERPALGYCLYLPEDDGWVMADSVLNGGGK